MEKVWRVPKNLCSEPEQCEVIKETPKTFTVGGYVPELVLKSRMATNYVCYFESEEKAWEYYNTGKEQERNRGIARDMATKLAGKGEFMLEYILVSKDGDTLASASYTFKASDNSEAIKFAKNFLEQKNSGEYLDNKCVQKNLYRLLPVEEMDW